ncbi:MAG: 60S ribosomal export protein NMD3 [Halobacteriota archaeon]
MTQSREFCPRCGDRVPQRDDPLPGEPRAREAALCDACYFDEFDLVDAPERLQVTVCSTCGAINRGNRWVDVDAQDYTDVAVAEVSEALGVHVDADDVEWLVEPEQVDETTIRMHCLFTGVVRDTTIEQAVTVPVKLSYGSCDRCGRIAGGYYASLIQLRADGRTPGADEIDRAVEIAESYVAAREATGDRDAFITEVDRTDDGADIKISTNQLGQGAATRITDELGGSVDNHPTLVTEDGDGNEVYRVTFVVRLPRYRPGDVIDPADDEGPVLVTSARGNLKGERLPNGDRYEASREAGTAPEATKLGTVDDAVETTVVTVEDDHAVQLLDPETYEATTVARPNAFDPDADTVSVLKHGSEIYIVPDPSAE